jgi:hypothetical protein
MHAYADCCWYRNVAFRSESHPHLLSPDVNVLSRVLLPLCGPEEYPLDEVDRMPPDLQLLPEGKQREQDAAIRALHLETLLLLCSTKDGRKVMRDQNVYRIIQVMHLAEDDERNKELAVRLVGLLVRDEEEERRIRELPSNDDAVEEV